MVFEKGLNLVSSYLSIFMILLHVLGIELHQDGISVCFNHEGRCVRLGFIELKALVAAVLMVLLVIVRQWHKTARSCTYSSGFTRARKSCKKGGKSKERLPRKNRPVRNLCSKQLKQQTVIEGVKTANKPKPLLSTQNKARICVKKEMCVTEKVFCSLVQFSSLLVPNALCNFWVWVLLPGNNSLNSDSESGEEANEDQTSTEDYQQDADRNQVQKEDISEESSRIDPEEEQLWKHENNTSLSVAGSVDDGPASLAANRSGQRLANSGATSSASMGRAGSSRLPSKAGSPSKVRQQPSGKKSNVVRDGGETSLQRRNARQQHPVKQPGLHSKCADRNETPIPRPTYLSLPGNRSLTTEPPLSPSTVLCMSPSGDHHQVMKTETAENAVTSEQHENTSSQTQPFASAQPDEQVTHVDPPDLQQRNDVTGQMHDSEASVNDAGPLPETSQPVDRPPDEEATVRCVHSVSGLVTTLAELEVSRTQQEEVLSHSTEPEEELSDPVQDSESQGPSRLILLDLPQEHNGSDSLQSNAPLAPSSQPSRMDVLTLPEVVVTQPEEHVQNGAVPAGNGNVVENHATHDSDRTFTHPPSPNQCAVCQDDVDMSGTVEECVSCGQPICSRHVTQHTRCVVCVTCRHPLRASPMGSTDECSRCFAQICQLCRHLPHVCPIQYCDTNRVCFVYPGGALRRCSECHHPICLSCNDCHYCLQRSRTF